MHASARHSSRVQPVLSAEHWQSPNAAAPAGGRQRRPTNQPDLTARPSRGPYGPIPYMIRVQVSFLRGPPVMRDTGTSVCTLLARLTPPRHRQTSLAHRTDWPLAGRRPAHWARWRAALPRTSCFSCTRETSCFSCTRPRAAVPGSKVPFCIRRNEHCVVAGSACGDTWWQR